MGLDLDGRVALVTGGNRGIGRAIALALADGGADVAVVYRRDEAAAAATVKEIARVGREAAAYQADVGSPSEVEAMVATVVADFGFVDILVNNAGIASRGRPVADTEAEEVERLLRVHAVGAHSLCRAVLPSMLAATLAKEERRHGIHVNVVAPGLVETDMGRRLAQGTFG